MSDSLTEYALEKLAEIEAAGLTRKLIPTDRTQAAYLSRGGRDYVSFSCNDYLNLATHPVVKAAAIEATQKYGTGAGASRLITGNYSLLPALEQRLAAFKEAEDCVVFGSGYLANTGIIPTLVGAADLVLADELSHACLLAGSRLSGAAEYRFLHNDLNHLEKLLAAHREQHNHCLILTDGVFSMDGDLAPVHELAALAEKYDAWLMVDDAHGLGVVSGGKGSSVQNGSRANIPLQMGTLSKAIGSYGGYVCTSKAVADLLRNRARTLVYSTGMPPAAAAAALAALDIIENDANRVARPMEHAKNFCRSLNLAQPHSPIVPIVLGAPERALSAAGKLEDQGFLVTAIRPPTVPEGTARLRITFTSDHKAGDVDALAAAIREHVL